MKRTNQCIKEALLQDFPSCMVTDYILKSVRSSMSKKLCEYNMLLKYLFPYTPL